MQEDWTPLQEPTPPQPDKSIQYEGPLGYYFRLAGIEEGAHAVFFDLKGKTKVGKNLIAVVDKSNTAFTPDGEGLTITGKESDDTFHEDVSQNSPQQEDGSSKEVHHDKKITDLSDADILDLLQYSSDEIPVFNGDVNRAVDYCRRFLDGVCIPIEKVYGEGCPEVKFGFVIPKKGDNFYNFFYIKKTSTIYINRNVLSELSKIDPNQAITATTKSRGYNNQNHERRALLWQIKDAKKHGMNKIVDMLKNEYNES